MAQLPQLDYNDNSTSTIGADMRQFAALIEAHVTQKAKEKFAELMRDVQVGELSPEEIQLYFDALVDLSTVPNLLRDKLVKGLEQEFSAKESHEIVISV